MRLLAWVGDKFGRLDWKRKQSSYGGPSVFDFRKVIDFVEIKVEGAEKHDLAETSVHPNAFPVLIAEGAQ